MDSLNSAAFGVTTAPPVPPSPNPPKVTLKYLHELYGHRNEAQLRSMARAQGWTILKTDEKYQCDICAKQKTYKRTQLKEAEASVDRPGVIVSVA